MYVFDFSKADFEGLGNHLLETDFSDCYNSVDVEDVWSTLNMPFCTLLICTYQR